MVNGCWMIDLSIALFLWLWIHFCFHLTSLFFPFNFFLACARVWERFFLSSSIQFKTCFWLPSIPKIAIENLPSQIVISGIWMNRGTKFVYIFFFFFTSFHKIFCLFDDASTLSGLDLCSFVGYFWFPKNKVFFFFFALCVHL